MAFQAWGNAMCKRSALHAGALNAILQAMALHKEQVAVLELGLMALSHLACDDDAFSKAMGAGGGVSAVVNVMKAHPSQQSMQIHGLRALGALCCFGSVDTLEAFLATRGEHAILTAMKAYLAQAAVQEAGCVALGSLGMPGLAARALNERDVEGGREGGRAHKRGSRRERATSLRLTTPPMTPPWAAAQSIRRSLG